MDGVIYYLTPDFEKLVMAKVTQSPLCVCIFLVGVCACIDGRVPLNIALSWYAQLHLNYYLIILIFSILTFFSLLLHLSFFLSFLKHVFSFEIICN